MNMNRQPKGIPSGGEFAKNEHDEASALSVITAPMCDRHGGEWGEDETCQTCCDIDGNPRPFDGSADLGPGSRPQETNELLDGYRKRVDEHDGDIQADARDMIESLESGQIVDFTARDRRVALHALTEIAAASPEDAKRLYNNDLSARGSELLDAHLEEPYGPGKYDTVGDAEVFESFEGQGEGDVDAPSGWYAAHETDDGAFVVLRQDHLGFSTVERFGSEAERDERITALDADFQDWLENVESEDDGL